MTKEMYPTKEEKVDALVRMSKNVGIESFILGFISSNTNNAENKPEKEISFRFEQIKLSDAVSILIAGLHQAVEIDLRKHPEYSDEYKRIFLDFLEDISGAVKTANSKVEDYKS